jgi:isopentenyl-diphosphate delta-isomerase type 1
LPADEEVDVVDELDSVVGHRTLEECLRLGLLHRAVAVLIVRTDGRFLLQQRSRTDSWQPGMWTLSCTGHVKRGEDFAGAARRELEEELGIRAESIFRRKLLIPPIAEGGLVEKELVAFFTSETNDPCRVNRSEIEGVREVGREELERMMVTGSLTPDSRFLLAEYLARV